MKNQSAEKILATTIERVRDLVDVSTIVGEPITINAAVICRICPIFPPSKTIPVKIKANPKKVPMTAAKSIIKVTNYVDRKKAPAPAADEEPAPIVETE